MIRCLFVTAVLLLSFSVHAQPTLLPEGEKVAPVKLLEFRDEPGRFIFVGKSQQQYNIFEIQNGQIRELLMTDGQVMYDGGSLLLDLEGGLHLFVPSDQKYNYVNGRQTSYIVYPDRAREQLQKRKFNTAKLHQLGLAHLLQEEVTKDPSSQEKSETHVPLPHDSQLFFLTKGEDESSLSSLKQELDSLAKTVGGCTAVGGGEQRLFMGTFVVFCGKSTAAAMKRKLRKIKNLHIHSIAKVSDLFDQKPFEGGVQKGMEIVKDPNLPFALRMSALRELLSHSEEWKAQKGSLSFAKSIWGAHSVLTQLGMLSEALGETVLRDTKWEIANKRGLKWHWQILDDLDSEARNDVLKNETYRNLVEPMRNLSVSYLEQIRGMDLDETSRLLFMQLGNADGKALPLSMTEAMMDSWLNWWEQHISLFEQVPGLISPKEMEDSTWSFGNHSGGIFQELKLSGSLVDVKHWEELSAHALFDGLDRANASPLAQLGLSDLEKSAKKKILTFIIRSDDIVAKNLPKISEIGKFGDFMRFLDAPETSAPLLRHFWREGTLTERETIELRFVLSAPENAPNAAIIEYLRTARTQSAAERSRDNYTGSDRLVKFIRGLSWTAEIFSRLEGYDQNRYLRNVIEIYNELLEDSERTLKNEGTYLAVLEASLDLQNRLRNSESKTSTSVTGALNTLQNTIQMKLLKPLPYVQRSGGTTAACEILFSPNPASKWHR